jgi:putative cobalt transporter subunit CbtB
MNGSALQPIPLRDLRLPLLLSAFALLLLWLVSFDQGQVSQMGSFLHELMHDGRHTLGVPCH